MAFNNNVAYAELFQTVLDEQIMQDATTNFMEENSGLVKYTGGKTVKVPKISMTGLGDYSRSGGYPEGSVTLSYEEFTMTQDRANQFLLDRMDVDETNFAMNATRVMSEFQRLHVIPEIDAYRISKIATYAIGVVNNPNVEYGYTPAEATIIGKLADAVEVGGYDSVIMATPETVKALEMKVGAQLSAMTFSVGGFDQTVPSFNGRPIIKVDPARMVTAIQTANLVNGAGGGWSKATGAKDVNFMVVPRNVPIAVDKLDELKVFEPGVVQEYSGWLIDYRRYHDLWVMDNKLPSIYVNIKQAKNS